MDDLPRERASLTEDLSRLMAALPAVLQQPAEAPARLAWMEWKRALIAQVRLLELREKQLNGDPYLWITEMLGEYAPAPDIRTEG